MRILSKIFHSINAANYYIKVIIAVLRGTFYILYYRSSKRNVKLQFPLKAFARIKIIGPGKVFIGKNCSIHENVFSGLTIITYTSNAIVKIGNDCALGGLTIRCRKNIVIGDRCLTAVSLIQDFLLIDKPHFECSVFLEQYLLPEDIIIQENAWIGGHCIIIGGTTISEDCVIGAGSVAWRIALRDYSLGTGNIIRRGFPISRLLTLMGDN